MAQAYTGERNRALERELRDAYPLANVIVASTQYATSIDALRQMGRLGAAHLDGLLSPDSTRGITWGKTIQSAITQLPQTARKPISVVQLVGCFESQRPASESGALVRPAAATYFGTAHLLNAPLYMGTVSLRNAIAAEPLVRRTLEAAKDLDVALTGIGGGFEPALG